MSGIRANCVVLRSELSQHEIYLIIYDYNTAVIILSMDIEQRKKEKVKTNVKIYIADAITK